MEKNVINIKKKISLKGCAINAQSYILLVKIFKSIHLQKRLFSKNVPVFWQLKPNSTKVISKAFKIVTTSY